MIGARKLLWVDCIAAGVVGIGVLALHGWLSRLYLLPPGLVLFLGVVNLLYGAYSFSLARRRQRPMVLIKLLVAANATWLVACLVLAAMFWHQASLFGLATLLGEGVFVGWLAAMEWQQRHQLAGDRAGQASGDSARGDEPVLPASATSVQL